jgi:hypothetical protein
MRKIFGIEVSEGLNLIEEILLWWLLPKLTGLLSRKLFLIECRRRVGSALEGIFYHTRDGRKEVLLKRRALKPDDVYSGKLDVFGTVIRTTDLLFLTDEDWDHPYRSYKKVLLRIMEEAGLKRFGAPPRIATARLLMGDRGPVSQTIVLLRVHDDDTPEGEWYPIDELPPDLIWEHTSLINLAAQYM